MEKVNGLLGPNGKQAMFRSREGGAWKQTQSFVVEPICGAVWEGLGVEVQYQGMTVPASPEARRFALVFYRYFSSAVEDGKGKLVPNPIHLMPGGVEKIVQD